MSFKRKQLEVYLVDILISGFFSVNSILKIWWFFLQKYSKMIVSGLPSRYFGYSVQEGKSAAPSGCASIIFIQIQITCCKKRRVFRLITAPHKQFLVETMEKKNNVISWVIVQVGQLSCICSPLVNNNQIAPPVTILVFRSESQLFNRNFFFYNIEIQNMGVFYYLLRAF